MSRIAEDRMRRALRRVASGGGHTWTPQAVTRQLKVARTLGDLVEGSGNPASLFFNEDMYLVYYRGDVDPDADTPAWTEELQGTVAHSSDGNVFSITDDTNDEHLYYYSTQATLDNAVGSMVEARVKIDSSSSGVNQGAAMSIFDGTRQYTAWLRVDGVNIDGQVDVAVDMTLYRHIKLVARGEGCELFIDGDLRQAGKCMNPTTKTQFAFGSFVAP